MASSEASGGYVQFSTRDLPLRERVPFWREAYGRHVVQLDIEPLSQAQFHAKGSLLSLPGLGVHSSSYSCATRLARPRELISGNDDGIALLIDPKGTVIFSQGGSEVALKSGDAVAILHKEPATMRFPNARYVGVIAPLQALQPFTRSLEDQAGRHVPRATEALRLLISYLELLQKERGMSNPEVAALAVMHVYDLMALALGATRDGAALAMDRGVKAARLKAIKSYIVENLGAHDLSVRSVAEHYALTPRYLHVLFEREGTTFSSFLLEQRLLLTHRMLKSPRYARSTIAAIAFAAGFGDLSHFNHCFRRRFGASPTEVRLAADGTH
jgi:AraC-like DNA-binding protein